MPQSNIRTGARTVQPLLPIEKKLIAWSLSIGIVLLLIAATINHFIRAMH